MFASNVFEAETDIFEKFCFLTLTSNELLQNPYHVVIQLRQEKEECCTSCEINKAMPSGFTKMFETAAAAGRMPTVVRSRLHIE